MKIRAVEYKAKHVGKIFKYLKTSHEWFVEIDECLCIVEFITYRFNRQREVFLDGKKIFSGEKDAGFNFSFCKLSHLFTLVEDSGNIDLHIDGLAFSVIYNKQAASFIDCSEPEDAFVPLVLESVTETNETTKEMMEWEKKAKNFRLVQREIPDGIVREKVQIKAGSHKDLSFNKGLSLNPSPKSTEVGSPTAITRLSFHLSPKHSRIKPEKKCFNFFLL